MPGVRPVTGWSAASVSLIVNESPAPTVPTSCVPSPEALEERMSASGASSAAISVFFMLAGTPPAGDRISLL